MQKQTVRRTRRIIAARERYSSFTFALLCAALFGGALCLRAFFGGIGYGPVLDDSIQYINYPKSLDYLELIMREGLFSSRPLAALTDLYLIGQTGGLFVLWAVVFSCLHGLSAALWHRLFHRYFNTGVAFSVLYALLPLGVEGTYWISAASRLVPGLLFCALAANLLSDFTERGGWWRGVLFCLCALLSYGFYEQVLVLSAAVTALQYLRCRRERRSALAFAALPLLGGYFLFTALMAGDGALGSRVAFALPTSRWYFDAFLPDLLSQMGTAFVHGGLRTLGIGLVRGFLATLENGWGIVWLVGAALLSAGVYFLTRPEGKREVVPLTGWGGTLLWGVLLTVAPLTPYLIVANPWFSLRATVTSFVGLGLLFDLVLRALIRRGRLYALLCSVLCAVFLVAGASEVADYKAVSAYDDRMAETILAQADEMKGRVGIFGVTEFPADTQNFPWHEHVACVASSEWSLYGKLVAAAGEELPFTTVPLHTGGAFFYHGWNTDMKRISGFDGLWAWEESSQTLSPLTARPVAGGGEHDFLLYTSDGSLYARVWEEDGYGYIEMYP